MSMNLAKLADDLAIEVEEASAREASEAECSLWDMMQTCVNLLMTMKEDGYYSVGGGDVEIHFPSNY